MIDYRQMPESARVWVYQSNRAFNEGEEIEIRQRLWDFVEEWNTHGKKVYGFGGIWHHRFIVLMADEKQYSVSGCSRDSIDRFIQKTEKEFSVNLLDRWSVAYRHNNGIEAVDRTTFGQLIKQGVIGGDTVVFNNLVDNKRDFEHKWEVAFSDSWHKQVLV